MSGCFCRPIKGTECEQRVDESRLIDDLRDLCSILASSSNGKYISCVSSEQHEAAQNAIFEHRGFCLQKIPRKNSHHDRDTGIYVSRGSVKRDSLVALYPGTVYQPCEKAFLSLRCNPFVHRCKDSTLIDGNNSALSKLTYRSCTLRDRLSPQLLSDMTWLTSSPANPLAIGQYINDNNHKSGSLSNVNYQEINLPVEHFPMPLRKFIPNVPYSNVNGSKTLRMVLLISTKDIEEGEELRANTS